MSGNNLTVRSRNYIFFRTVEVYNENEGRGGTIITGFRFPLFPGKYKILVDHVGYGNPGIPPDIDNRLKRVHDELKDPHELPKKIPVRDY
ncbi:carboxypeptidase-like regulatory domain-containing protein [Candidatus Micrarchaeota archaeon]|nr:carboxypeptidase-like regulatory domain-containing protein [Candidatus Micrarchaeota archaeon]MBU1681537.1 carboxypeptidase-like regulatory domain-containing protein [Candidatus Micrarchaeota archaeon]